MAIRQRISGAQSTMIHPEAHLRHTPPSSRSSRIESRHFANIRWLSRTFVLLMVISQTLGASVNFSANLQLALSFNDPKAMPHECGTNPKFAEGRHGYALEGLSDAKHLPLKSIDLDSNEGTLSAWVQHKRRDPDGQFQYRWIKFNDGTQGSVLGHSHTPTWFKCIKAQEQPPIILGQWNHWCFTWQGDRRALYIDGALAGHGLSKKQLKSFLLNPTENKSQFAIDDLMVFSRVLTNLEIQAIMPHSIKAFIPAGPFELQHGRHEKTSQLMPSSSRGKSLMENPSFAPYANHFIKDSFPRSWGAENQKVYIKTDCNGARLTSYGEAPTSIMSNFIRGIVIPHMAYKISINYHLSSGEGQALLRFRNQMDMGTQAFALKAGHWQTASFIATAPADYDVGLYYLEALVKGPNKTLTVMSLDATQASPEEIKRADINPEHLPQIKPNTVRPDERWILDIDPNFRLSNPQQWSQAWKNPPQKASHSFTLKTNTHSLWDLTSPEKLFQKLFEHTPPHERCLKLSRPNQTIAGGYGLDPLPAQSLYGAALLYGIASTNNGISHHVHQKIQTLVKDFCKTNDRFSFYPFWSQSTFTQRRIQASGNSFDPRQSAEGRPSTHMFGHTAPGVLCSAYIGNRSMLVVLANPTSQKRGKMGDLWVDHQKAFQLNEGQDSTNLIRNGNIVAIDPLTQKRGSLAWNRNSKGYIKDIWASIAIAPGDVRYILITYQP